MPLTTHSGLNPKFLPAQRKMDKAETDHLVGSGRQVADCRKSIELSSDLFPEHYTSELSRRAYHALALRALKIAERRIEFGDCEAAVANLRESLKCSRSDSVTRALVSLLSEHKA